MLIILHVTTASYKNSDTNASQSINCNCNCNCNWVALNTENVSVISTLVGLLSLWFSHLEMCVKWNGVVSGCFSVGNGTRQGGVLSPYFFSRYIRGLLQSISASHIGCYIGCMPVNILAYADDIVMLSPSWRGLQTLIICYCVLSPLTWHVMLAKLSVWWLTLNVDPEWLAPLFRYLLWKVHSCSLFHLSDI